MKAARVFTKEDPCTKIELHNCFFDGVRYSHKPVVNAKMEIGDNAPKYLVKKGYVVESIVGGVDYYRLTDEGEEWLREGLQRYLVLHPERSGEVKQAARSRVIRRAPAKALKPALRRRTARG
jgi:hypothetical protein